MEPFVDRKSASFSERADHEVSLASAAQMSQSNRQSKVAFENRCC